MLSKREFIANMAITGIILIVGTVLISLGYNEAFFVQDSTVQAIFKVITDLSSEMLYIVFFTLLYFAIDKEFAKELLIGFLISVHINSSIKALCRDPRPPTNFVNGKPLEVGYGFPSAHSQLSISFWGYVFFHVRRYPRKATIQGICIALMILIPVSRVVIGVHDLQDIIGGAAIGMIFLNIYLLVLPKARIFDALPLITRILIGMIVVFVLWVSSILILPEAAEDFGQDAGLLMACALAFPLESRFVDYQPSNLGPNKRAIAGIFGITSTFVTYLVLNFIFAQIPSLQYILRFFRYFLLGLIVTLGIPMIMKRAEIRAHQTTGIK